MKKLLSLAIALAMCTMFFTACDTGESSAAADPAPAAEEAEPAAVEETDDGDGDEAEEAPAATTDGGVIYGIYKAGDQTWFIDEGAAAEAAAKAAGYDFVYVDAQMDAETYLNAIDNAIASGAAGIVTCIPDQTMSQAVIDKVTEANIPIVAADDALEDTSGAKLAPWVGINAYVIGQACGEWIADYMVENELVDDAEVGLLFMTMDTVSSCVPRTEGEYDRFTEMLPEFDESRMFYADNDGTTEEGNTAAAAVFTAHPEIKKWMIVGANEECVIGAVRALEDAGLDADACAVGLGGYMAKDEYKKDYSAMKAAAYFSSLQVGEGSINVLLDMINGSTPAMETAVDALMVTPDNYVEIMGSDAD